MTLEELIKEYHAVTQQLVEIRTTEFSVSETLDMLERRIVAQIKLSPGGKLLHLPSGIVYTAGETDCLGVVESLYTTRDITLTDEVPAEEDALASNWAKNGHHHQACS